MKNETENPKAAIITFSFLIASLVAILLIASFTSCGSKEEPAKDTKEIAEESNDAKFTVPKEDDAQFLVDAAIINLHEIQLGQLAQNNGTTVDVKELGKMMEKEHTSALKDLEGLAAKKQITIPKSLTGNQLDDYNNMQKKAGSDFDKAYCDKMVTGHREAIEKFDKESTTTKDADIKAWTEKMLPALQIHLDHSIACQEKTNAVASK